MAQLEKAHQEVVQLRQKLGESNVTLNLEKDRADSMEKELDIMTTQIGNLKGQLKEIEFELKCKTEELKSNQARWENEKQQLKAEHDFNIKDLKNQVDRTEMELRHVREELEKNRICFEEKMRMKEKAASELYRDEVKERRKLQQRLADTEEELRKFHMDKIEKGKEYSSQNVRPDDTSPDDVIEYIDFP